MMAEADPERLRTIGVGLSFFVAPIDIHYCNYYYYSTATE